MLQNNTPTDKALELKKLGKEDHEIINELSKQNFKKQEISNALDLANVKNEIAPPLPSTQQSQSLNLDEVPSPSQPVQENTTQQPQPGIPQPQSPQTMPTQPVTTFAPEPQERANYDMIEQIAESVISEKWDDLIKSVGDLKTWKEKIETDLAGTKQEILRMQSRFENLQKAVLGKVNEYSEGITDLNSEIKAMEKVFEKILEPLTRNVKELEEITKKMKK